LESVQSAKSAEAEQIMSKITDGSVGYFTQEQSVTPANGSEPWHQGAGTNGQPVGFQQYVFPGGAGVSMTVLSRVPAGGTKLRPDFPTTPDERATVKHWGLELEDPLYYQYNWDTTGTGSGANATIQAEADFDNSGTPNETHTQTMFIRDGQPQKGTAFPENEGQ